MSRVQRGGEVRLTCVTHHPSPARNGSLVPRATRRGQVAALFAALVLLSVPVAAGDPTTAASLAETLRVEVGMEPLACPDELDTRDRVAVCGAMPHGLKAFKTRIKRALEQPDLVRFSFIPVVDWEKRGAATVRASYWIGAASVEALFDKARSEAAILVSRPYKRCGEDIPFSPVKSSAGEGMAAAPVYLSPDTYPLQAHRQKIDGTVAVAVSVDAEKNPTVICIHHASPSGYGFELPAIEAVRSWNGDMLALENAEAGSLLTVLVDFSRVSARKKPVGVQYH